MMSKIQKICVQDVPGLRPFVWSNIPNLAVITGINGAGKTQLLTAVQQRIDRQRHAPHLVLDLEPIVLDAMPFASEFGFVPWNISSFTVGSSSMSQQKSDMAIFVQTRSTQFNHNQQMLELSEAIGRKLGPNYLSNKNDSYFQNREFVDAFIEAWTYQADFITHQHLGRVFSSYYGRKQNMLSASYNYESGQGLTKKQIENQIGRPPWELINELLESYKFKYRVTEPGDVFLDVTPMFYSDDEPGVRLALHQLSSGEQMIVSLVLWSFDPEAGKLKSVIMMDEPDAHLHPDMARMFKEIISDKLVDDLGIQVVLTTHSAVTVSWFDETAIFVMNRLTGITKSSKSDAIEKLTSGLLYVQPKFKIVPVEDEADVHFYRSSYDLLTSNGSIRNASALKFVSANIPPNTSGGRSNVIKLVQQWYSMANGLDGFTILHGLVDQDGQPIVLPHITLTNRYCFENYLCDPIILFAGLVDEKNGIVAELAKSVGYTRGEELKLKKAELNFQIISDAISEIFSDVIAKECGQEMSKEQVEIVYMNGTKASISKSYLTLSGKDVVLKAVFRYAGSKLSWQKLLDISIKSHILPDDLNLLLQQVSNG